MSRRHAERCADPAYQAQQRIWNRRWHEAHKSDPAFKAKKAAQMRKYSRDPELVVKHKARWAVRHALSAKHMTKQPCERCGGVPAQAHHDDYSKPLDVRWLCRRHHEEHHRAKAAASA